MIQPMTGYIHVKPIKENISSIIHAEEKDTNRAVVISVGYGVRSTRSSSFISTSLSTL